MIVRRKIALLLITILLLSGCGDSGLGWSYELPHGYNITEDFSLALQSPEYHDRIEVYDVIPHKSPMRIASNGQYFCVLYVNSSDTKKFYNDETVLLFWYILDDKYEIAHGPYLTESDFNDALEEFDIANLEPWHDSNNNVRFIGVKEFCYNDKFVCVKRNNKNPDIPEETVWSILDTETDIIYGPYRNEQEFMQALKDLAITDLSEWISTTTKPEGAKP